MTLPAALMLLAAAAGGTFGAAFGYIAALLTIKPGDLGKALAFVSAGAICCGAAAAFMVWTAFN